VRSDRLDVVDNFFKGLVKVIVLGSLPKFLSEQPSLFCSEVHRDAVISLPAPALD
jgi:hypothetical protein